MASRPQTVLYLHSSSGRYGADRQLRLMVTGLDPSRYRSIVVLPNDGPLAEDLRADGAEVHVRALSILRRQLLTPLGLSQVAAQGARDAPALGRLARRREVVLVHSNTSVVLSGAAAARFARVPHVWHVREIFSGFGPLWPPYRRFLSTASALPCVSRAAAEPFPRRARTRVIHDGLAADVERVPRDRARMSIGLDPDRPVIAVLGRISDWKGQDVLVRGLAQPELRERGAVGLIAGEPWPGAEHREAAILELASELGVLDRLRLVGFRDDVGTVLGASDVIAVPSTSPDPLPGSAIEAAAAGCAVVAAAHGGLPEIVRDGETGRLVTPGDPAALARACAELIDSPQLAARLGAAAARDVRERFSAARLLDALQALYDEVLARG